MKYLLVDTIKECCFTSEGLVARHKMHKLVKMANESRVISFAKTPILGMKLGLFAHCV